MSFPAGTEMFQFPAFACWSLCIQPNIPTNPPSIAHPRITHKGEAGEEVEDRLKVGFPIRRSPDQRVLAPPRSLSQRATSFIASQRQGIRQKPLCA